MLRTFLLWPKGVDRGAVKQFQHMVTISSFKFSQRLTRKWAVWHRLWPGPSLQRICLSPAVRQNYISQRNRYSDHYTTHWAVSIRLPSLQTLFGHLSYLVDNLWYTKTVKYKHLNSVIYFVVLALLLELTSQVTIDLFMKLFTAEDCGLEGPEEQRHSD